MSLVTAEIGSIAAEEIRRIVADGTRERNVNEVVSEDAGAMWGRLVTGGWLHITTPAADTGAGLREMQEVARVHGAHLVPVPLVTTLLVGRWFGPSEEDLDAGITFALAANPEAVTPHAAPGRKVFTADGTSAPLPADAAVDDFAASLPVALQGASAPVSDQHAREAAAVPAAEGVGCADAVTERSLAYAATREQFGRPISVFQAVRHHLANMHVAREEAWTAAIAAGNDVANAGRWARVSLERSRRAVELGIQVHGGVGFTWEAGLHNSLRHVLALMRLTSAIR